MSTPSIAERVAAGVQWLDANDVPGWWKPSLFDLDGLNMDHPCYCVLGQRYGNYYAAPVRVERAVAMGFDTIAGAAADTARMSRDEEYAIRVAEAKEDEFDDLQAEWVRVIEERRTQAEATS